jgi:hypothetical protein
VGFLTEIDVDDPPSHPQDTSAVTTDITLLPEVSAKEKLSATAAGASTLPLIGVYRVEDAALPPEVLEDTTASGSLPSSIPIDKVMTNIVQNLDFKSWSDNARNMWYKDFKSPPSKALISDTFWYCICVYFKAGRHTDVEKRLFDRISFNFVNLFSAVAPSAPSRKDFFFRCYADGVAQAVLYSMFLAYPKSRGQFTDKFRRELYIRISYWTTGISPEFVDTSHWKLNLGGGDVLQASASQAWQRNAGMAALSAGLPRVSGAVAQSSAAASAATAGSALDKGGSVSFGSMSSQLVPAEDGPPSKMQMGQSGLGADSLSEKRASLAHRAPRPLKTLRYSPLVENFLRAQKYTSINLVAPTRMNVTVAEERSKMMDVKHAMLVERATESREHCDKLVADYDQLCLEVRKQERQRQLQAQTARKRLEIRRREVLRSDPHEYANYLVSLHLLQQGMGQTM